MLNSVFAKTLFDMRRSLPFWCLGMAALSLMVVATFQIVADTPEFVDLVESYPEALLNLLGIDDPSDYLSPSGYLSAQLFSLYVPLFFLIFATGQGVRAVAGEEDKGTLDLLLSHPVSRDRVVAEKLAAMVLTVAVLGVALLVVIWLGGLAFDANIGVEGSLAGTVSAYLLGMVFGTMALAAGAVTGRRVASITIVTTVAVLMFFMNGFAPLVDPLRWAQKWSFIYYFIGSQPLDNGFDFAHMGLLALFAVAFSVMAFWGFRRRDVGV